VLPYLQAPSKISFKFTPFEILAFYYFKVDYVVYFFVVGLGVVVAVVVIVAWGHALVHTTHVH
jgi:hypothetical protein